MYYIATTETVEKLLATSGQKIEEQMEQIMIALSSRSLEERNDMDLQLMENMKKELGKLYQINEVLNQIKPLFPILAH